MVEPPAGNALDQNLGHSRENEVQVYMMKDDTELTVGLRGKEFNDITT